MITVLGSTNLDQIGTVPRLPKPGETIAGGVFSMAAGGKGANQALAARRAGAAVRHVSAVGNDDFATIALALLERDGVDLTGVARVEGATGIAMILVDRAGENVIAVLPGANGRIGTDTADTALAGLGPGDLLVLQQEIPHETNLRALAIAREKGARSLLNIAPFLETSAVLAAEADIVIANETEFALLSVSAAGDLEAAMDDWARTSGRTIIVTLGPDGVRAAGQAGRLHAPALKVEPVDTVGAGDTFCGYLAACLSEGLDLGAAMARAAIAASLACLEHGAQKAIPYREGVEELIANSD